MSENESCKLATDLTVGRLKKMLATIPDDYTVDIMCRNGAGDYVDTDTVLLRISHENEAVTISNYE